MRWEKLGRIFTPRGQAWWCHEFAQAPSTLLFDDFVRVYFSSRPPPKDGQYVSYTGFADLDRRNLTRVLRVSNEPILGLGGLGCFDEFGVYPVSVVRALDGALLCYYAGWTRKQSVRFDTAIGLALGDEKGERFRRLWLGPVLGPLLDEPFVLSGPKVRWFNWRWWMFYIAGVEWLTIDGRTEPIYKIRSATCDLGAAWKRHHTDLIPGDIDEVQSGPDVHWDAASNKYVMLFCHRRVGHHPGRDGGLRLGYAESDDLLTWQRDDAQAGIDLDPDPDAWDGQHVRYPHWFEVDGVEYLLYNGNQFGKFGFGLARRVG